MPRTWKVHRACLAPDDLVVHPRAGPVVPGRAQQTGGHADLVFGEAAELLGAAGHDRARTRVDDEIVGRNILDGRWTFQVVDEFDDLYYQPVRTMVKELEEELIDGRRHVFEAEMKDERRSRRRPGQERRPPAAHSDAVDTGTEPT